MKHNRTPLFTALALASLSAATEAAQPPIVATEWFPLVNGAIIEYKNDAVVSSTTARVTVTTGQTFNGVVDATSWKLSLPCDATTGKGDWAVVNPNKGGGNCSQSYERFMLHTATGLVSLGDRTSFLNYGYGSDNWVPYVRESKYANPFASVILKNGFIPGEYVYRAGIPGFFPAGYALVGGVAGQAWGVNGTTATSTYSPAVSGSKTVSGFENFRDVGVYAAKVTYGATLPTLYVEDAILDNRSSFAPSQLRYQTWSYAKGIGPVVITTGDYLTPASGAANFKANGPGGNMLETFVMTRHNLPGCPGYDAALPALPANSGNDCAKFYTTPAPAIKTVTEYYNAKFDYYFTTSSDIDKATLNALPDWALTGKSFKTLASADAAARPLTRYYFDQIAKNRSRGSHFYTLLDEEVSALNALNPGNTNAPRLPINEGVDSYAYLPAVQGVGGSCSAGLVPVYRLFRGNVRFPDDPNHRFTTDKAIYDDFVSRGWDGEGVKLCVPPNP